MQWFKDLNLTPKFLLIFSVLITLAAGMVFQAINIFGQANDRVGALYRQDMAGSMSFTDINYARAMVGRDLRDAILHVNEPGVVAEDEKTVVAELDSMKADIDASERTSSSQESKDVTATLRAAFPAYDSGCREIFQRIDAKDAEGAVAHLTSVSTAAKPLYDAAARAIEIKKNDARERFEENDASYRASRTTMIWVIVASVVGGFLMTVFVARAFSNPLRKAVEALDRVSGGDLTVSLDVDTKDEIGKIASALNNTLEKLRSTLEEVNEGAIDANSASQQLAAATEAIASGAQHQAASLEETSASLEEITATVRQSADNARQASQLASGSTDAAVRGQGVVADAVTAMAEANESSSRIAEIISTIDEIAFQTNLLAVNAAVEAARAGDEGRGFAVVAAEVRSLAQRSAEAAKEIKVLIQDSLRKVERGTNLINKSGETLQGIVNSVKQVTAIVGEIATTAGEQSAGIEQVNSAMTLMDRVTQSNSAQTEELSATAHSLSDQSAHLLEMVGAFILSRDARVSQDRRSFQPREAGASLLLRANPI